MDINKIVGDRIRIIRTERGLSQEELAHRADIDASHFGKLERGEVNPSLSSLEKITGVLEITLEDLFRNIQPSTKNKDNTTISLLINKLNTLTVKEQKLISSLLDILFKLMKRK